MPSQDPALDEWLQPLSIDDAKLQALTRELSSTYGHLALHSQEQFLSTPVTKLPTGNEKGTILAIDFGGTNLRIAFVGLLGSGAGVERKAGSEHTLQDCHDSGSYTACFQKQHEHSWPIGEHLKVEKAEDLFVWIGDCLAEVVAAQVNAAVFEGKEKPFDEIPLGITFSFPMMQNKLAEATLMPMGKGFAISSKLDLGEMVLAGYKRHTEVANNAREHGVKALPKLSVAAITNDAVATLCSLAYSSRSLAHGKAVVGLILGTGCNAAIPMAIEALHPSKCPTNRRDADHQVVVNTEMTIKGAAPPLRNLGIITQWDTLLDQAIPTPGYQPFEYMTAGHYLGEIVRLVVLDYFTHRLGFQKEELPRAISRRNALTTEFFSRVVATTSDATSLASKLNADSNMSNGNWVWTADLANVVWQAEQAVVRRSAAMIAAATVGLLSCSGELDYEKSIMDPISAIHKSRSSSTGDRQLLIAYCGGLITLYRGYKEQIQSFINQLVEHLPSEKNATQVLLHEASDGGLFGAAALAGTVWSCSR